MLYVQSCIWKGFKLQRIYLSLLVMVYVFPVVKVHIFIYSLLVYAVCFEGTQRSFTVSELEGQFCINITRVANESDPLSVGYQTLATMGTGFASREYYIYTV